MNGLTKFICTALGLVFVVAGYVKVMDPQGFALAVANYQLLPDHLTRAASMVLAWLELLCGLCLVFGVFVRGAALVITVLMVIFLAATGYNVHRGLDVSCGCFSTDPNGAPISTLTLLRDAALLLASFALYAATGSKRRGYRR